MKNKIFLLLIIQTLFSVETIFAQQITFQKTFGGTGGAIGWNDCAASVQQTTDGGYIITGFTGNFGAGDQDVYLIKTDANGDTTWTKTYGGPDADTGSDVQQTADGGYIITGHTTDSTLNTWDFYLIKTDSSGNLLWTKAFGGTGHEHAYSVKQTSNGGYIIVGSTSSGFAASEDAYLIKTNANGNTLWKKTFGRSKMDAGISVRQTTDGGYIFTGYSQKTTLPFDNDVYLVKTDIYGNLLWSKTFGGPDNEHGYSIQQTADGGYIIAGYTNSFGAGGYDAYLIKTDSIGNLVWSKTFGGVDYERTYSVQQTTDGGFIVIGSTSSFSPGVYLIKTNANGDLLWTKTFGGTMADVGAFIQQTSDGGYIIAGFTQSFGAGSTNVYLIKTDSMGNSGCNQGSTATIVTTPATQVITTATLVYFGGANTVPTTIVGSGGIVTTPCTTVGVPPISNQSSIFNISPNPFSNEINISCIAYELSEIILYDITSRKLLQRTFTNSTSINTAQLSKGIYVYEIKNKNGVIKKGKVVKE